MLFGESTRHSYQNPQLIETICQLRFPTILSIGNTEPAEFQEAVRADFPRYVLRKEPQPPKLLNPGTPQAKLEQQPPITNYNFISTDGLWKINLTYNFVALSTLRYSKWEDFAGKLDSILAHFLRIYEPAFFERIGLRYVNAISRRSLGLEGEMWDDLVNEPFTGVLSMPDVTEEMVGKSALDVEVKLSDNHRMKLHTGPGLLNTSKGKDPEVKFIIDGDFSASDKEIPPDQIVNHLNTLHDYAVRLFNAATTPALRQAMGMDLPKD